MTVTGQLTARHHHLLPLLISFLVTGTLSLGFSSSSHACQSSSNILLSTLYICCYYFHCCLTISVAAINFTLFNSTILTTIIIISHHHYFLNNNNTNINNNNLSTTTTLTLRQINTKLSVFKWQCAILNLFTFHPQQQKNTRFTSTLHCRSFGSSVCEAKQNDNLLVWLSNYVTCEMTFFLVMDLGRATVILILILHLLLLSVE